MALARSQRRNARRLALRMAAPQDEDARRIALRHRRHAGIGNRLPAALCMAARLPCFHRQRVVQKQHALPRPAFQIARSRRRNAAIGLKLFVNIPERGRQRYPIGHRKAQAMRLPRPVIRVLPQDHHFDRLQRCQLKRAQPAAARRIDHLAGRLLFAQPASQPPRFWRRQRWLQHSCPACRNSVTHRLRIYRRMHERGNRPFPSIPIAPTCRLMTVHFHEEDLPAGVLADGPIAVDTETMGLITPRDRLCVVQISDGQGDEHLVRFKVGSAYDAPNLKAVLADPARLKLYHFARFDLAAIEYYLGVTAAPVFCTKIASKLTRTYTDRHGLKNLVQELLSEDISKAQQTSDWGAPELNEAQRDYAASDVRYLHRLRDVFVARLERESRTEIAQACFDFLPTRARLDIAGWADKDIFSHES